MREFFHGWKHKLGIIALVVTTAGFITGNLFVPGTNRIRDEMTIVNRCSVPVTVVKISLAEKNDYGWIAGKTLTNRFVLSSQTEFRKAFSAAGHDFFRLRATVDGGEYFFLSVKLHSTGNQILATFDDTKCPSLVCLRQIP